MKAVNIVLVVLGLLIFVIGIMGGGLVFRLPVPFYVLSALWFIGLILVALGLWWNTKEKKGT